MPVPEVAEGDEIEPCDEDPDTPDNSPATGAPTINGTAQVGETLTADTSGIADADGLGNVQYEYQWLADDSDISGATNATYTLADADEGKAIKVQVSFTDDAGNDETLTSAATDVVSAAPAANSPATGAPTITGTAQVGQTLTADTSGIADANGLSNVQYEYQWLADDTDIAGASGSTYTLTDSEESKAITVQVSFTDDAGNDETLTSAATDVVVGTQPTEPPDKPTGLEATATHGQVVLTWDDPQDDSITGYVILRRVRVNDTGGDFDVLVSDTGTAALTYTDDTVAASLTYTYRIKAINEHGVSERSRWFHVDTPAAPEPEEEQAAEPPDQPTGLDATATHDSVTLTWDDPGDDTITGYVVLRRIPGVDPQGHFNELVSNTGTDATTYTDDTVSAETRYTYRIKAINEHGVSERSRWVHINTPAAPVPDKPKGLRYRIDRDGTQPRQSQTAQVTISWDAVTGADHYRVSRCERNCLSGSPSGWAGRGGNVSGTEFTDTVTEDRVYRYRVRTIDDDAYFSAWSEPLLVYVASEPVQTENVFVSLPDGLDGSYDDGDARVELSWTCPDNPTKVTIRRNGGGPRDNDEGVSGDATLEETLWEGSGTCPTSYNDSGVTEGYKYSYTLKVYTTGHNYLADKSVDVGDQLPILKNLRLGNNGYIFSRGSIRLSIISDTGVANTPVEHEYKTLWRPDRADEADMVPAADQDFANRSDRFLATNSAVGNGIFHLEADSLGDLVPGVVYRLRFRIGVTNGDDTTYGPWSYITATVVNGEIRAPYITSLAEGRTGTGSDRKMTVTLNWQSRVDAAKYEIWRAGPGCTWADFDTSDNSACKKFQTTGTGTSYTDSDGIEPSSKYHYLVYAVHSNDKVHYGQWHGEKVIRTSSSVDDPAPPSGLTEES